ncbi:sensor histidine kinase [Hymenobacter latericus]|uniref:sensor histidine kinase n=1 Tax=Hymenobacter sp. YIM 151858-1 TaxID=2987688 RepID=UPI002227A6FE|nr:sensor histidine kinase [Hymenobacter sp. YIM 151858-1]UYZ60393.1 sensor histidine kinase [Hymenobacter sp. YIM 151858-1]
MSKLLVIGCSLGYLLLLFAVAYAAEHRSARRRSLVSNPYVYALSMAVYCTAWTYYGSVGRAVHSGLEFVTIYLGPTLLAPVWWLVLRKIIRICRQQSLTSLADFVSARYGKSASLGALVTVLCVLGVVPYIALQIKAIAQSFDILTQGAASLSALPPAGGALAQSTAFYTTAALAFFTIIFGVRSVEATERHEGIVLAIALESLIKLVAFLAVGAFVTFGLFGGFTDVFNQAEAVPALQRLFTLQGAGTSPSQWLTLLLLSGAAILLLPRQFQVAVVENASEDHLRKAMWLFPLYLIVINVFVLPVALGGALRFGLGVGGPDADTFVLALPLSSGHTGLALLTYLGGVSAASSMIIVETIALGVMISNHLLMPLLVRIPASRPQLQPRWFAYLGRVVLHSRRAAVVLVLLLAYVYYATVGRQLPLVNIGLVSFAAVAQLAPAVLGGLYWKGGTRMGATAGLIGGFAAWFFTLVLPTVGGTHMVPASVLTQGAGAVAELRPEAFMGLEGLDPLPHGLFWSWLLNIGLYVGVSLAGRPTATEQRQADAFVDVFRVGSPADAPATWKGAAPMPDLRALLVGFLGRKRANQALRQFEERYPDAAVHAADGTPVAHADPRLLAYAETLLAGTIGPASARLLLATSVGVEEMSFDNVVGVLRESQQLLEANRKLRKQSQQLQRLTEELQGAYDRLRELDQQKDEFLYTVTHELRTPLTSIRALSEILADNPDIDEEERFRFQSTITKEAERLSRLITLVLDLEKFESGKATLERTPEDVAEIINDATEAVGQLVRDKQLTLDVVVPPGLPPVPADRDRLMQVLVNLLSNAVKSCKPGEGRIGIAAEAAAGGVVRITVSDNGKGIDPAYHELIFDKFFQAKNQTMRKPEGSGLGLAITKKIVELHAGRIGVVSAPQQGARFWVELPAAPPLVST